MVRFKRLVRDDLKRLTRGELLDRLEREQQYWFRKLDREGETPENHKAYEEFRAIMHAALNPAEAVAAALDLVTNGHGWSATYWDELPE
jgi:hypothetical protein